MANTNLTVTKADEKVYNLTITAGDAAQDITGSTVTMSVKRNLSDTEYAIQKVVTSHEDAENGITKITLDTTDTDIALGNYYYDIEISGGSLSTKTILKGKLEVTWQVTEA